MLPRSMSLKQNIFLIGKVDRSHGVSGDVIISFFCDPVSYAKNKKIIDGNENILNIKIKREISKNRFLANICDTKTRDEADLQKDIELFINKDALPALDEDEFFLNNLIDLAVFDAETDESFGVVSGIYDFGAGTILEIKLEEKNTKPSTQMIPLIAEAVFAVNIEDKKIVINKNYLM